MKARIAVFMMLTAIVAMAGIPQTISYQGKLTDMSGVGENDTLDIRFRVFDVETGGDSIWTTTVADVPIVHGLFDVNIGPIDLPFDEHYWLEILVDGSVLTPRVQLTSSPYAFRAAVADSFTGGVSPWTQDTMVAHWDSIRNVPVDIADGDQFDTTIAHWGEIRDIPADIDDGDDIIATQDTMIAHWDSLRGIPVGFADGIDNDGGSDGDWTISGLNMYSAVSGKVGIGTTSPECKLSLDNDGGIIAIGTFGSGDTVAISGAGTRLIWNPRTAAFRAGYVDGDQWNDYNISHYSFAVGANNKASNDASVALGWGSTADGFAATAMGCGSTANGSISTAMGHATTASGWKSTAMGEMTIADGEVSVAMGYYTTANGDYSLSFGQYVTASADNAIVIGSGYDDTYRFENNIPNSMMVGFNGVFGYAEPTLFVGPGAFSSPGKVGIGISYPENFNGDFNNLVVGSGGGSNGITIFSSETTKGSIAFADDTSGTAEYRGLIYYDHSVDKMFLTTGGEGYADGHDAFTIDSLGNVGIGIGTPSAKLDVNGNTHISGNLTVDGSYPIDNDWIISGLNMYSAVSGNVGIGNNYPGSFYNDFNDLVVGTTTGKHGITIFSDSLECGMLAFAKDTIGTSRYSGMIYYDNVKKSMFLTTDGEGYAEGNDAVMIDSLGNVGIHNTIMGEFYSGADDLVVGSGTQNHGITIFSDDGYKGLLAFAKDTSETGAYNGLIYYNHSDDKLFITTAGEGFVEGDDAFTIDASGNVGIGETSPARKLFVNGDAGGTTGWYNDSDVRLKRDIVTIDNALEKVGELRGVYFEWNETENHKRGRQMGFIAQETLPVIPEVVDKAGEYYGMDYAAINALLVEAIKAQQAEIDSLRARIEALENK